MESVDQSFGCSCGGWHLAVQKTRSPTAPAPPKKEESANTENKSKVPSVPETV